MRGPALPKRRHDILDRSLGSQAELGARQPEPLRARHTALWGTGALLGNRIPLAAGVALALPAAVGGAAVLADEARFATGHDCATTCCTALRGDAVQHTADPVLMAPSRGCRKC